MFVYFLYILSRAEAGGLKKFYSVSPALRSSNPTSDIFGLRGGVDIHQVRSSWIYPEVVAFEITSFNQEVEGRDHPLTPPDTIEANSTFGIWGGVDLPAITTKHVFTIPFIVFRAGEKLTDSPLTAFHIHSSIFSNFETVPHVYAGLPCVLIPQGRPIWTHVCQDAIGKVETPDDKFSASGFNTKKTISNNVYRLLYKSRIHLGVTSCS